MARSKKYKAAQALLDKEVYSVDEALALLEKTTTTNFDSSCEIHIRLGVDPKQADQNIRTTAVLPNGTGREVRVVAFVEDGDVKAAKEAGAMEAGTEDLIKKIEQGWSDFDIAVAVPDQMKFIGKVAKILGQKRLMPSPKSGTVTPDFATAISELKKGRVELRVDKEGNLHNSFGKVSFGEAKLKENFVAVMKKVMEEKPQSSKGVYVKNVAVCTAMGPGIKIETSDAVAATR